MVPAVAEVVFVVAGGVLQGEPVGDLQFPSRQDLNVVEALVVGYTDIGHLPCLRVSDCEPVEMVVHTSTQEA